jgi:hypothetical protein
MGPLALRDLAVLITTAVLWRLELQHRGTGPWLVASCLTGVATAFVGFLAHEWGHLVGSIASDSAVDFPPSIWSVLLFHFDSAKNDRRQFLWMSAGGYLASFISLAAIVTLCPWWSWASRIAIALAGLGVVATFVLEVPITWRVWRGAELPTGVAYRPHDV